MRWVADVPTPLRAPLRSLPRRLPAHVINGLTVALGIALVQAAAGGLGGLAAAFTATSGAVFASLPDVPNAPWRTWRRVLTGGVVGCVVSLAIGLVAPHPVALGVLTSLLAFGGSMALAWGIRAAAISFVPILALVFTMAAPPVHGLEPLLVHVGWTAFGAALYLGWAWLAARALQPRYRSLALARALEATAALLTSRAQRLAAQDHAGDLPPLEDWIQRQASLDERLQAARDLLFAEPDAPGVPVRIALLLFAIDLRDTLLASELDYDLLGHDALGERWRHAFAESMRHQADTMAQLAAAVRRGRADVPAIDTQAGLRDIPAHGVDATRLRLAQLLVRRAGHMSADIGRMQTVWREGRTTTRLATRELELFVSPEGWPLGSLRAQWRWSSAVLRHALRAAVALGCAYFLARALPWASHPNWLVLSVAVVLRGNLFQTLARRDARIAGTVLGCLFALALAQVHVTWLSSAVFLMAVGTSHAFAASQYLITSTAATVMALLQAHLAHPEAGFGVAERLGDTVLGALLAWGFSYLWPWWERRGVIPIVDRLQRALAKLATETLRWPGDAVSDLPLRLARREAYDAIGAVAAAAQRTSAEPARVRLPPHALAALVSQSHVVLAHIASARTLLTRRAQDMDRDATVAVLETGVASLQRALDPAAEAPPTPPGRDSAEFALPADDALLPWLERRLAMATRAALRSADAAAAVKASAAA